MEFKIQGFDILFAREYRLQFIALGQPLLIALCNFIRTTSDIWWRVIETCSRFEFVSDVLLILIIKIQGNKTINHN